MEDRRWKKIEKKQPPLSSFLAALRFRLSFFHFLFSIFCLMILSGCSTEYNLATQQQETLIYGTDKEVSIGEAVSAKMEQQYDVVTDVDVNERARRILERVTAVCDRKDIVYFVKVLDKDVMNAVSLPGGYVYIFKGLMDKLETDDQIAGVIAHEVGHITARHAVKRIQNAYGAMILQGLATRSSAKVAQGVNFALISLFSEYSQQDEFEADRLGVKYMKKAGYDPNAMVQVLVKLREEQEKSPAQEYSYWRTHPFIPQRISVVNQAITGKMDFKDYLNLMGE
ncbi:MAG: M48 family metalloprotease [Candidatus Omnitrophica bacterium]|nr:M48 family metalloprotease [Candidatus Omnitrophota bacterium]